MGAHDPVIAGEVAGVHPATVSRPDPVSRGAPQPGTIGEAQLEDLVGPGDKIASRSCRDHAVGGLRCGDVVGVDGEGLPCRRTGDYVAYSDQALIGHDSLVGREARVTSGYST